MSEIEYIDTVEALEIMQESWLVKSGEYQPNRGTLITWIKKYGLGLKFAGRYRIDKAKLIAFLEQGEAEHDNQATTQKPN